jgi:hypothetical protein
MFWAAFGCTIAAWAQEPAGDAESSSEPSAGGAVGGALAGWGAVPVASEAARSEGTAHLWAQLQVWATLLDQDVDPQADPATYGDPEADAGFSIRRGRIGIDGYLPMGDRFGDQQVDYAFAVGYGAPADALTAIGSEPTIQLVDAFGRWALPTGLGVTSASIGVQRVPFSRESMMSSADLVFQEAAVGTNWLGPNREAGATASQSVVFDEDSELAPQILVRGGLFNGGGDLVGDQGPGMMGTARVELAVGDTYRTWSAAKQPALGVGGALLRNGEPSTRETAIAADLLGRYSLVSVLAEVVSSTVSPTTTNASPPSVVAETTRLSWLAQLSVWIPVAAGGSGVEVAGRYATFDDATALDNSGDVSILHAGATWRNLLPRVDLGAGYVHRAEPGNLPNDTVRVWAQVRPQRNL